MSGASAEDRAQWARHAQGLVGQLIGGKYRLEKILGRGGMGTIYVAEQQPLGRKVALKVLHSSITEAGADPEFGKRFLLEAATLSQLSHPNIVVVYDYGQLDGDAASCFMAMELLEGKTITEMLAEEGPFDPARALRITRDIARGLRVAHEMGVIHRDLKPANVMLCQSPEGETVKVLDFGLVKVLRDDSEELTAEGRFLGSPRYMSPEQITRQPLDGRADLYSLGVILFRMLTNVTPFAGDHAVQTLMAHLQQPVPKLGDVADVNVAPPVEAIVTCLLQKEAADRYADASALIAAIDALWPSLSDEALPQSAEMAVPSFARQVAATEPPTPASLNSVEFQLPAPAPEPPPAAEGRTVPLWIVAMALAVAGVLAAVAGWLIVPMFLGDEVVEVVENGTPTVTGLDSEGNAPMVVEPVAPTPTEPATDVDVDVDVNVEATQFALTIRSEPSGASVERDGQVLGETPLELSLDSSTLEDRPATFTLRLPGRAPHVFTQGPTTELAVAHDAVLPRLETGRRGGRRGGSGGGGSGGRGGGMSIKTSR